MIIVTTKSGKQGKLAVNFNSAIGVKKLSNELEVLDPYEFVYGNMKESINDSGYFHSLGSFRNKYGTYWDTLANYKNANKSTGKKWLSEEQVSSLTTVFL